MKEKVRCQPDPSRLPPLSVAIVLVMTDLETKRDVFGLNFCRDRVVGAMRKSLGPLSAEPPVWNENGFDELKRDETRALLAQMCALCPHEHCKMKGWGITGPASY